MRRNNNNRNAPNQIQDMDSHDEINQISYGKRQNHQYNSNDSTLNIIQQQKHIYKQSKKQGLDHLYKESYQPAKYARALQYRHSKSYMKKLPSGHYKQLDLFVDTEELKYFGVGLYLYIEFFRRMCWLFFVMSVLMGVSVYINWLGSEMSSYKASFSTYLIKSTAANYSQNKFTIYDGFIITISPATCFAMMFFFYLIWKNHFLNAFAQAEEDNSQVKPEKFCLEIEGLEESYMNESQLQRFFSSFGPVYEVSLVRRYKNKLSYFQELDEIEEELKQEELEVVLGGGDRQHVVYLRKQKDKLQRYISTLKIFPKTTSAFIHFQYQKSKVDCLTYFNDHFLFDRCSHSCVRSCCFCCINDPQPKYLFRGQKLYIKNEKVAEPEDINWESFQINCCSKFFRILFGFIIILVFLAASTTIIGLGSIYISQNSANCQNLAVAIPQSLAEARTTTDEKALKCYCEYHLIESFSSADIKEVCKNYSTQIQISQGIQFAVIFVSSLTNFIFGFVNNKLINFIRPASKSQGLLIKTAIYTIFLVINTIFIPLLIYGEIYGFKATNYVSLLTLISADIKNLFKIDNISFYSDFSKLWYRNVSVIFVNFIIFNTITVWIFYLIDKFLASKQSLQEDEGKILQKSMNEKMTSYQYDVYKQTAGFYLVIIMCMLFCGGIPALIPLGFINILSRYITTRSLLQNSSTRIEGLGEDFCSLSLGMMPFVLIVCPLISQWMLLSNSNIYPNRLSMQFPYFKGITTELDKQLYLPFYLILSLAVATEFFLYNTLIRCCSWLCNLCYEKKEVNSPYHTRPFNEYSKGMNTLCSYNIRNNEEMKNVILNLEKYLVDKQMD